MMTPRTWLVYLDEHECARRLADATLGRLAVIVDGHPEVFPVNHVVDPSTGHVAFPTVAGTKLHAALEWPTVAFEIDGIEPDQPGGPEGWSVLVVGRAVQITDPDRIAPLRARRHVPWGVDETSCWVEVVPVRVTGRRIGAAGR